MNLILFEPSELHAPLPRSDRRARHLLEVLRRQPGDSFDAALINGPRGKGTLTAVSDAAVTFTFTSPDPAITPDARLSSANHSTNSNSITLIVGLPRPQTARDILRDATTLGVDALHFIRTEKAEASYAQSSLWSSGEWRRHVLAGAEQAFDSQLPQVTHGTSLAEAIATLAPARATTRIALDNYEAPHALGAHPLAIAMPVALAIGAERGWSAAERERLRAEGFTFVHLGARVLRTETAVLAALAIVRAKLGLI